MSKTSIERNQTLQAQNAAIAWIKSMSQSGYVFVERGDPTRIDEYAIRKDKAHGDDSAKLIDALSQIYQC